MNTTSGRILHVAGLAGLVAAGAIGLSACGSGADDHSSSGTSGAAGTPSPTTSNTAAHLTTAKGLAVYLFAPDTDGTSHCYGGCANAWPPVPAGTKLATVSGKVDDSLVGTTKRTDGSAQLTYAGHPLYRYAGDAEAGQTTGQGLDASGGLWWLVAPKGAAIKAGASSDETSDDDSGNYQY